MNEISKPGAPLAVITGASSGIGYELAIQFAKAGFDLIIVAENDGIFAARSALVDFGSKVEALQLDLTSEENVMQLVSVVKGSNQKLTALALNAGVGAGGAFLQDTTWEKDLEIINLNVISCVLLAKRLIPDMVASKEGYVLFTSSIASLAPGPYNAIYHASKAFIQSFTEAIRDELKDTGVTITSLMPGATQTSFFARADMLDTKVGQGKQDDPADVAKQGFEALMRGDDKVIAGSYMNKIQGIVSKFLPDTYKAKQMRSENIPLNHQNAESEDAIAMLKRQHREAEVLFNRIKNVESGECKAIFSTLAKKLLEHMALEENVFYPAATAVDGALTFHSLTEHADARDLIQDILRFSGEAPEYLSLIKKLEMRIINHVEAEENELFDACSKVMDKDELIILGDAMRDLVVTMGDPNKLLNRNIWATQVSRAPDGVHPH